NQRALGRVVQLVIQIDGYGISRRGCGVEVVIPIKAVERASLECGLARRRLDRIGLHPGNAKLVRDGIEGHVTADQVGEFQISGWPVIAGRPREDPQAKYSQLD